MEIKVVVINNLQTNILRTDAYKMLYDKEVTLGFESVLVQFIL